MDDSQGDFSEHNSMKNQAIRRDNLLLLSLAILLPASLVMGYFGISYYVMEGHPVSVKAMSQVHESMTTGEVRSILGKPTSIDQSDDDNSSRWGYTGMTWCIVTVQFDEDDRVVELVHDH